MEPAPGPLENYAESFDDLFGARAQREGFRRYLEGLLLPAERNKTRTALANTEPVAGAQRREVQSLQWFLSESGWDPEEINERRLELLLEDPATAPNEKGVLIIDEHGDRKWGKHTAHVGRQWLANIGKTDNGVVSVSSLWADEEVYYPLEIEPYTPARHIESGKDDARLRTKLKIACQLGEHSVAMGLNFRAMVADSFHGEDRGFKRSLGKLGVGYVLSLKKSHCCWWHREGTIGALWEAAEAAGWKDAGEPGGWTKVIRTFRENGHREGWWALEVENGPYGKERAQRALVVTTDPEKLPDLATWYLTTNLPAPGSEQKKRGSPRFGERLGGGEALQLEDVGGAELQAGQTRRPGLERLPGQERPRHPAPLAVGVLRVFVVLVGLRSGEKGKKEGRSVLSGGDKIGKGVAGAVGNALALLEVVLRSASADGAKSAA